MSFWSRASKLALHDAVQEIVKPAMTSAHVDRHECDRALQVLFAWQTAEAFEHGVS